MALDDIQDILEGFPGLATFDLVAYDDSFVLPGSVRFSQVAAPVWKLTAQTETMKPSKFRLWAAKIRSLDSGKLPFYAFDLLGKFPILYPDGSWPTGIAFDGISAAVAAIGGDNKSFRIDGLPSTFVISEGDYFSVAFSSGTLLQVYQAMESATANVGGLTPFFEVRPHILSGTAVDNIVAVKKPSVTMVLLPDSLRMPVNPQTGEGSIGFEAIQVFENIT